MTYTYKEYDPQKRKYIAKDTVLSNMTRKDFILCQLVYALNNRALGTEPYKLHIVNNYDGSYNYTFTCAKHHKLEFKNLRVDILLADVLGIY